MSEKEIPNLAGVATKDLVETKGGGSFSASYINWSRTMNLLHTHAPGWMVSADKAPDGGIVFPSPKGAYLMIRLIHIDGAMTPACPQAIMDNRNMSIPMERVTSRDVTDTHRRGACMVLAMHFGLGYELWAKDELESGYHAGPQTLTERVTAARAAAAAQEINNTAPESKPDGGAGESSAEKLAKAMKEKKPDPNRPVGDVYQAMERIKNCKTEKGAIKSMEDSVWKYKFSQNDRKQMKNAVDYQVKLLEKRNSSDD